MNSRDTEERRERERREREERGQGHLPERIKKPEGGRVSDTDRILNEIERVRLGVVELGNTPERRLERIESLLKTILKKENQQMAFAQDVLAKITSQTTLIGSIKAWIQALPTDVVSAEDKAAILANLDTNSAELSTAIPAGTPLDPNTT